MVEDWLKDAVLVANSKDTKKLKNVLEELKINKIEQSEKFRKVHRPWGWYESLFLKDFFQVKVISVNSKGVLSLQKHFHRSEHWVVVEGTATVIIDGKTFILNIGESIYVPKKSIHRLENQQKKPLVLIEVQTGNYLGEDDIVRYEDIYNRI